MSDSGSAVVVVEEDLWRAGLYALIGRLFFDGPDSALLAQLSADYANTSRDDPAVNQPLGQSWQQLALISSSADAAALQHEHAALFVGIGKTPVTPYTSAYVSRVSPERHLLLLRQRLAQWGLGRDAEITTPEDHVAGVCDAMRHLILRGEPIEVQREFFNKFIYLSSIALCNKLIEAKPSSFYLEVSRFTRAFLEVEQAGFDMISSP